MKKNTVSLCVTNGIEYKQLFEIEKKKIESLLIGDYVSIEHVGSTAIPFLLAKPIIDIAIGINDFSKIEAVSSILEGSGYIYLANHGELTRKVFVKSYNEIITHHIHVEEYGQQNWLNHVLFRDMLLASEELRSEYAKLKVQLYGLYAQDRVKYTLGKGEFIQRVLQEQKLS